MNPYGIQQVDLPGVYGAVTAARDSRIRQMLAQRQIEAAEREEERNNGIRTVLARAYGGQQGQGGKSGTNSPSAQASGGLAELFGSPSQPAPAAPAPIPSAAPAQPQGLSPDIARQLIAIDPPQGAQIAQALRQMDEAQLARVAAANTALAQFGQYLIAEVPEAEWGAEIQRRAPELVARGVPQDQIARFQPNQRNVAFAVAQARDIEKLVEDARPRLRNVGPGDTIIDERNPNAPPVYESEYIQGPSGELFPRPGRQSPQAQQTPDQLRAAAEDAIRRGAPREQVEAELQRMLQGGAGQPQASRTFPRRTGTLTIDRNNNPGALRIPGSTRFQSFGSPAEGIRAQESLLRRRYLGRGLRTVADIVETYAPRQRRGGDNTDAQVDNYIRHVSTRLGVRPGQVIDPERVSDLARAMREFETGRIGP